MRTLHLFAAAAFATIVAGCSTTVSTRQALEPAAAPALRITSVEVTTGLASVADADLVQLQKAIGARLAALPQGPRPATVAVTVTEFAVVDQGMRFLIGALAGNTRVAVSAKVMDATGRTIADFDVQRTANPGGYGAFYDQKASAIDAVAQGIAEALGARSAR
jgi:hypothetical protein